MKAQLFFVNLFIQVDMNVNESIVYVEFFYLSGMKMNSVIYVLFKSNSKAHQGY